MNIDMIIQLVNGVGFPIAACCALFYTMYMERKHNDEQREKDREEHSKEVESMRQAVENNTLAITKLLERMESNESNN